MIRPIPSGGTCAYCTHAIDDHEMHLVLERPLPAGFVTCPEPECPCWATWGINPNREPAVADMLREAVIAKLDEDGHPVPDSAR